MFVKWHVSNPNPTKGVPHESIERNRLLRLVLVAFPTLFVVFLIILSAWSVVASNETGNQENLVFSPVVLGKGAESTVVPGTLTVTSTPTGTPTSSPTATPTSSPTATATPTEIVPLCTPIVPEILLPFDPSSVNEYGPRSFWSNWGRQPEVAVSSTGGSINVLAQDYSTETPWDAVLLQIAKQDGKYTVKQALTDLPMLDRIMDITSDSEGNRYYATAVDERDLITPYYPPLETYRSDIVRVYKIDPSGDILFDIDLDVARHDFYERAEMIINPMFFGTARLEVGDGELALVHTINTGPDWNIDGVRHQKALSTRMDAITGAITRVASIWVSHSFDQRLYFDGERIVEIHLGDAYPRAVALGFDHKRLEIFHIKGELGDQLTATRLGNAAKIEGDPGFGLLVLFATESTSTAGSIAGQYIMGPRNLAIVRVSQDGMQIDTSLPDTLTVTSNGIQQTNHFRWLTNYSSQSNLHAERPKLVAMENGQYMVLWERWHSIESADTYQGAYAMLIDDEGNILKEARLLSNQAHLPFAEDAFLLDGQVGWMTSDSNTRSLILHLVDENLNYQQFDIRCLSVMD